VSTVRHRPEPEQHEPASQEEDIVPDHGDNQETPAPVTAPGRPRSNRDWWPNQPDLRMLRQPAPQSSPLDGGYSYREQFKTLDVEALKRDVIAVMTTPQDWWPADYSHSSARSRRSTRPATRGTSSSVTSSPRGTRS